MKHYELARKAQRKIKEEFQRLHHEEFEESAVQEITAVFRDSVVRLHRRSDKTEVCIAIQPFLFEESLFEEEDMI